MEITYQSTDPLLEQAPITSKTVRICDLFTMLKVSTTLFACLIILILALTALGELVFTNYIGIFPSKMYSYIVSKDRKEFRIALFKFIGMVVGMAFTIAIKYYIADRLAIIYRRKLGLDIHNEYMKDIVFYEILLYDAEIDNPDSRIAQDVFDYTTNLFHVLTKIIQTPAILIWYTYQMWSLMNGVEVLICYSFAIISLLVSKYVMSPLISKTYLFQEKNADFRLSHVELKENAESICLSEGTETEHRVLSDRLSAVLDVQRSLANHTFPVNIVSNIFAYYGGAISSVCVFVYLIDHMKGADELTLSSFANLGSFYTIMLISGFTSIFSSINDVSKLCGYATRILELKNILNRENADHQMDVLPGETNDLIEMKNVNVRRPTKDLLIQNLSFQVSPNSDSLFITGPSGSGKSSIFRVLGKIWPAFDGVITMPSSSSSSSSSTGSLSPNDFPCKILLLTQTPYIPPGTIEECIAFPKEIENVSMELIQQSAKFLEIEYLFERNRETWQEGLSPGEKQRIALARVFVHSPMFVLLDEATSALPQEMELAVYQRLVESGASLISIAHNQKLKNFHKRTLEIDGIGGYRIYDNDNDFIFIK